MGAEPRSPRPGGAGEGREEFAQRKALGEVFGQGAAGVFAQLTAARLLVVVPSLGSVAPESLLIGRFHAGKGSSGSRGQWSFSPFSSMATNLARRRARVSGFLASPRRQMIA